MNSQINAASEQLENAFELFNQFSEKLAGSYGDLESHVTSLTKELAEARSERLIELAEKEVLAKRLEGLLDALPAGIVVLDASNCITQTNPVARLMLGAEIDNNKLLAQSWQSVAQKSIKTDGDELRLADGRWVNLSVCPLCLDNTGVYQGKIILISDITETRTLQMKLNRQHRLTSLGEMIASLAHQIRTPLSSALLYISTLNHPLNDEKERICFADKAKERLRHLERMVNDMLIFARGDVSESEYINAVEIMTQLKNNMAGPNVRFEQIRFDIDSNLHNVIIQANRDVLLSALQNIIDNAIQACCGDNSSDMESREAGSRDQLVIEITAFLNTENQFEINIADNGCGMSEEIKDKVLEPFFTTRSSGTGLGLAVVNTIVNRYNGEMNIDSKDGVGSDFNLKFPCAEINGMLPSNLSSIASNTGKKSSNNFNNTVSAKNVSNKQLNDVSVNSCTGILSQKYDSCRITGDALNIINDQEVAR
jgi:two-component system sensor histidine kinase FlrB